MPAPLPQSVARAVTTEVSPHLCVDRHPAGVHLPTDPPRRLALLRAKRWPAHQRVLHVRFLGGDSTLHRRIAAVAQQWTEYANVRFVFDNSANAIIRIGFTAGPSWSYIGTDARDLAIAPDAPTMNFGWLTPSTSQDELQRVVLHEFGHALGLVHEHQSPAAEIPWDIEAVYNIYAGPPNFWSRADVNRNVLARYAQTETNYTEFDGDSIMLYPIPPELTNGQFVVGWNRTLSPTDRSAIRRFYPFPAP